MITFGGVDYATGDTTDYILAKHRGHYEAYESDTVSLMNKIFYFLPKEGKFCSCLLYENLIKELLEDMQPNLDDAIANSKFHNEEWYKNLFMLDYQVAGWPCYRENSIAPGKIRPEYWTLVGLQSPKFKLIEMKNVDKAFIRELLEEEKEFLNDVKDFEKKIGELIERL